MSFDFVDLLVRFQNNPTLRDHVGTWLGYAIIIALFVLVSFEIRAIARDNTERARMQAVSPANDRLLSWPILRMIFATMMMVIVANIYDHLAGAGTGLVAYLVTFLLIEWKRPS